MRLLVMNRCPGGQWNLLAFCVLQACAPRVAPARPAVAADSAAQADVQVEATPPDSLIGPPRKLERDDLPPRSNGELMREPDLNQTLTDARRLGFISGFQEMRRGLLRLQTGPRFAKGTSVSYNFGRLRMAYRKSIDYYGDGVLEIWEDGRKLGEYTVDGLFLGPSYQAPR
jgi:hypothetical protein